MVKLNIGLRSKLSRLVSLVSAKDYGNSKSEITSVISAQLNDFLRCSISISQSINEVTDAGQNNELSKTILAVYRPTQVILDS